MGTEMTQVNNNGRFSVSNVVYDNPVALAEESAPRMRGNNNRMSSGHDNAALVQNDEDAPRQSRSRLSVTEFFSSLMPGSGNVPQRNGSRANSIFSEFFKDSDRSIMDYSQEAAPRLESYRNSLTMNAYMIRPSLDQLHEGMSESQPSLAFGKGQNTGVKFGWVKGVYIRCLLNIWGVMLFLRMGWMTGQCGILLAIVIVLLSTVVTVITTLSMSAICTNGAVRGGGAYYLISRSLGPEFGGVTGIILFLANALSGAMYIVGAAEAVQDILLSYDTGIVSVPSGINDIRISGVIILVLMMSITGIGMEFENKTQMVLLTILVVAMMDYFIGAFLPPTIEQKAKGFVGWNLTVARENLGPGFRGETFFSVFAVFFPSVTGILAGANISGDLKDPCSAIPKGTLHSIMTTSLSYIMSIIWLGFTFVRTASGSIADYEIGTFNNCTNRICNYGLLNDYEVMKLSSGYGPIIYAGVFAASLSSALVCIVSAPRILQALCVDKIIPWLNWFGKGYGNDNDPRRALALTCIIAVMGILIGDLNTIAPYISNFFMAANGLINFSCFHASYVKSPGFRPGFRYYNLWLSLIGSLLCAVIMFVMDWTTALFTVVLVIAIYVYINKICPDVNWGSSFQGYSYKNALYYLNKLSRVEDHVKNYRPAVLVLTGNASSRPQLVDFAGHLTKDHGLLLCGHISKVHQTWQKQRQLTELNTEWLNQRRVKGFYTLVESETLCKGVSYLCQVAGIGKMTPNILLMGFKQNWDTCHTSEMLDYFNSIHEAFDAHLSVSILRLPGGTDYSRYYDTPDGLPLVSFESKRHSKKKRSKKKPNASNEIIINLETVIEEESTPNSIGSASTTPVSTTVSVDTSSVECTLHSAAEKCEQLSDSNDEKVEVKKADPPQHISNIADIFLDKQKKGTIDVWWLYDTGGLTLLLPYILTTRLRFKENKLRVFSVAQDNKIISDEHLNLAALLHKFRIPFEDLTILSSESELQHKQSEQRFEKIIMKWITKDEVKGDATSLTRNDLNTHKRKTNQYLRLRELLEKHSKEANLVVMTLPIPRKDVYPAPLYMAWLDILTYDMPPFLLVRGNQSTVLTFYS